MLSNSQNFAIGADGALACILAVSGLTLSAAERSLFQQANPFGVILFKRNCESPAQLRALISDIKAAVGRNCPILIDQEGGRVQRLRPPHWRDYKPMKYYGDLYVQSQDQAVEELRFETLRLCEELIGVGVNVDCAPVLDLFFEGAHDVIGDRAFSADPSIVARLALSVCRHMIKVGVTPIIKHIPGHGRALADSHLDLPCVETDIETLRQSDFAPFRALSASDVGRQVWAMTAHILYPAIDTDHPVSVSPRAIDLIRREIGFEGILLGDDLDMKALDHYGTPAQKALASLRAGCDLALYCAGDIAVMESLAAHLPALTPQTLKRLRGGAEAQESIAV